MGHPFLLRLSQASFYDLSTLPKRRQVEAETGTYTWIRLHSDPGILVVPGSQSELAVSSGALVSIPHVYLSGFREMHCS